MPLEAAFHSLLAVVCLGCTAGDGGTGGFAAAAPLPRSRTRRPRGPLPFSVLRDPRGSCLTPNLAIEREEDLGNECRLAWPRAQSQWLCPQEVRRGLSLPPPSPPGSTQEPLHHTSSLAVC